MHRGTFALSGITIDCIDPVVVAEFWSRLFDVETRTDADLPGWLRFGPVVPGGPHMNFQPVPEPKAAKARIHLDLWVDNLATATEFVRHLGGTGPSATHTYDAGIVAVVADPEGNEFCLVASSVSTPPGDG